MKIISLITDAPQPNLAMMKISSFEKAKGKEIMLNQPLEPADYAYGSWLFSQKYHADCNGGPGYNPVTRLPAEIENCRPDYSLYPGINYSLGYTWSYCPRQCGFCCIPKQNNPREHKSIWTFHDVQYKKIKLLNNNTFSDPQWRATFEEIWDAGLIVKEENGYDLRLLDEEKAEALAKTKFDSSIHFAWDRVIDEKEIISGLTLAKKYHLKALVYILVGWDSNREEDLYRCQVIHDFEFDPYVMPYTPSGGKSLRANRAFKRFIDCRYYRKYKLISEAWEDYNPNPNASRN